MMKNRFIRRAGLRRLTGRLPTAAGKSLDLLVAISPWVIDALRLLQRHYRRQPLASQPEDNALVGNHELSEADQLVQPPGSIPRHTPAKAADHMIDPAAKTSLDKLSS